MENAHKQIEAVSGAEQTRRALVHAALILFGKQGFDGTSTREIAAAANANIGSIAYHFGGKEGLRIAVADHIVATVQNIALRAPTVAPADTLPTRQEAEGAIIGMVERMFSFFVLQEEAAEIVPFVLREMFAPSLAFDRIYDGMMEPLHRRCCQLWEAATGEPAESEETRINVFLMIGQILYFRLAREAVRRRMEWTEIGPQQGRKITDIAIANISTLLRAKKDRNP
ncbi:MAG: CerR family C-terminal domain-containing protein [Mesorhizobium sp.]